MQSCFLILVGWEEKQTSFKKDGGFDVLCHYPGDVEVLRYLGISRVHSPFSLVLSFQDISTLFNQRI